jgi:hypothetical protein
VLPITANVTSSSSQAKEISNISNASIGSRRPLGKLELDRGLARMCGFDMNEHRLVSEGYRVPAAKKPRRDDYNNNHDKRGGGAHRQQQPRDGGP